MCGCDVRELEPCAVDEGKAHSEISIHPLSITMIKCPRVDHLHRKEVCLPPSVEIPEFKVRLPIESTPLRVPLGGLLCVAGHILEGEVWLGAKL